ncbi:hypothetical protein DERF_011961 [Dermatophagoides farinae]|uniref:Uncharacterized protein n=1 Tax=Dermatophagoides farinae TaxID=6954 RepID=A0A922KXL7_DERFA|nr:hypothetical protein DERF_011961 [Dermatophagoides farinae]
MSSLEESYQKRKKALRKFDDYFNSLTDGHDEELCLEKMNIRQLIEQIRSFNRNLADDDNLYEDELVEQFNSRAHRLAKFLNDSTDIGMDEELPKKMMINKDIQIKPSQRQSEPRMFQNDDFDLNNENDHIDSLLTIYYIGELELTDNNWFDYYPKLMEFIVRDPKIPDERTRINYLKQTVQKNPKAIQLIKDERSIKNATKILEEHFDDWTLQKRALFIKEMIEKFHFDKNRESDEANFRQLLDIALHIRFNVSEEFQQKYFPMILFKLPNWIRARTLSHFIRMMRAKLRIYDAQHVLKAGTYEELEKLFDRLIVNGRPCPICYHLHNQMKAHPIVRCRHLNEFRNKYNNRNSNNLTMSMADLSISSNQLSNDQSGRSNQKW